MQKLWEYQRVDIEVDRFELEMRKSPTRQTLVKHREFLLTQQELMRKIEGDVTKMSQRMDSIRSDLVRLDEELRDLQETMREEEPETIEIARKSLSYAQKLVTGLNRLEQELAKMRKDAETRGRQQHEVRVRAAKVRTEFDQLKEKYDLEYKKDAAALSKLRGEVTKAAEGIPGDLVDKYKQIKQHCMPPISKLLDGSRCGGCNMNLPQAVLRDVRTGAESVECENCGRIVLVN
jgi:predicted  nucleic acid-binding Zn-ribbon protein